jgi:NADH-quinone oxidoreductase subunit G
MGKLVTLTIDDKKVTVPEGTLIVDAAKKIGIDIPVFCYHPKMEPVGMCRMCLVDIGRPVIDRSTGQVVIEDGKPKIQFGPKLETACTTPVSEGMVVVGMSDKVIAARKEILEFLLTSHPLDCPVCDKGGECPLQNLTMRFGPAESRFIFDEKMHAAKHVPLGDLIFLDRERCIQCARCVRFQEQVAGDAVIGFYRRGRSLEIVTYSEPGFDSIFSGNTTDICPVGALTTADFRFGARPWELNTSASICPHCPVGCNIVFNVRREAKSQGDTVIKRVLPRQNEAVNEIWICDKGRFAYHFTESKDRLSQPLVRREGNLVPATWEDALALVAENFKESQGNLLTLAGGCLANEDLFNLKKLTDYMDGKAILNSATGGGDLVAQVGLGQGSNFKDMGKGTAILVVASDLHEEAPIWWLRVKQAAERGAALIVVNPRSTRLDRFAMHRIRYHYGEEVNTIAGMIPGQQNNLSEELRSAAEAFASAENSIILFGNEGQDLSTSKMLAQVCAQLLITTNHYGKPNNGLIGVWKQANTQGAWDMGFRPVDNLSDLICVARSIYIAGADPAAGNPVITQGLKNSRFVVVQDLFLTETAQLADVVLPARAFSEREGTFTSGERRVQRYFPAVSSHGDARCDYEIPALIGQRLGFDIESRSASLVMLCISKNVPDYAGLTYQKLSQVMEQEPIIGRADVYYGGTSYDNHQGLGVQLASAIQSGENISFQNIDTKVSAFSKDLSRNSSTMWAIPITRLYNRSRTVLPSQLLSRRIPEPYIALHSKDAERFKLEAGDQVQILINENPVTILLKIDDGTPQGFALLPREMGLSISVPTPVQFMPR